MAAEMSSSRATLKRYESLEELLVDKDLAALGDSYVNFVYSLAMSQKLRRPTGAKVNNQILAEAVIKSGLRKHLPHRVDRHDRGNAAEALLVFAWLSDLLEMDECTRLLSKEADVAEAFAHLIRTILNRLGVADEHKHG
jgi:hypothetical protein